MRHRGRGVEPARPKCSRASASAPAGSFSSQTPIPSRPGGRVGPRCRRRSSTERRDLRDRDAGGMGAAPPTALLHRPREDMAIFPQPLHSPQGQRHLRHAQSSHDRGLAPDTSRGATVRVAPWLEGATSAVSPALARTERAQAFASRRLAAAPRRRACPSRRRGRGRASARADVPEAIEGRAVARGTENGRQRKFWSSASEPP